MSSVDCDLTDKPAKQVEEARLLAYRGAAQAAYPRKVVRGVSAVASSSGRHCWGGKPDDNVSDGPSQKRAIRLPWATYADEWE